MEQLKNKHAVIATLTLPTPLKRDQRQSLSNRALAKSQGWHAAFDIVNTEHTGGADIMLIALKKKPGLDSMGHQHES